MQIWCFMPSTGGGSPMTEGVLEIGQDLLVGDKLCWRSILPSPALRSLRATLLLFGLANDARGLRASGQ